MKLVKKNIHENKVTNKTTVQFTLDDDFNVSDALPDIEQIVKERGRVHIESVRVNGDKAEVNGELDFALLYMAQMPVCMKGKMNFREIINIAELVGDEITTCTGLIEDLTIKTINSRKISVKAIIALTVLSERLEDTDIIVGTENENDTDIQMLQKDIEYSEIKVNAKDNFRIRESVQLSSAKPNIAEILWHDVDIKSLDTRITDEGLMLTGEISIFILYMSADENQSLQWYETTTPFDGIVDISGSSPDMVVYVKYNTQSCDVEVKPDYDGEEREIALEMVLGLDIKAYEEQSSKIVEDMYSPTQEMLMKMKPSTFKKLLMRNNSKCRVNQRVKVNSSNKMLQICNCTGTANIDDVTITDEGIEVDGVVDINVFYVTSDDNMPMGSAKNSIPFSHKIQIKDVRDDMEYSINVNLEQLTAAMSGTDEIEVKAVVCMDTICFIPVSKEIIDSVDIQPMEDSAYFKLPSIVGYIADGKDTLWDVAKRYHTTTDSIRISNRLSGDRLNRGDKLILVKAMRC